MKRKIKIVDSLFLHSSYSTIFKESKYIEWYRTFISNKDKMVFYTDNSLYNIRYQGFRIAWLLESPEIAKNSYN